MMFLKGTFKRREWIEPRDDFFPADVSGLFLIAGMEAARFRSFEGIPIEFPPEDSHELKVIWNKPSFSALMPDSSSPPLAAVVCAPIAFLKTPSPRLLIDFSRCRACTS